MEAVYFRRIRPVRGGGGGADKRGKRGGTEEAWKDKNGKRSTGQLRWSWGVSPGIGGGESGRREEKRKGQNRGCAFYLGR